MVTAHPQVHLRHLSDKFNYFELAASTGERNEYDDAKDTDLVPSLSTVLSTQRGTFRVSTQRCAEGHRVQRQSVIYRMRRVEEITGKTVSATEDISMLWRALSA